MSFNKLPLNVGRPEHSQYRQFPGCKQTLLLALGVYVPNHEANYQHQNKPTGHGADPTGHMQEGHIREVWNDFWPQGWSGQDADSSEELKTTWSALTVCD